MNIAEEFQRLQDLHLSGALSDEEFAVAKAAVLSQATTEGDPTDDKSIQGQLDILKLQNEIAHLDRQWELECERYMVRGRYGRRYPPSPGWSVFVGAIFLILGILLISTVEFRGNAGLLPLFGFLLIPVGIGLSIYLYAHAIVYEKKYKNYRQRRSQLWESMRSNE